MVLNLNILLCKQHKLFDHLRISDEEISFSRNLNLSSADSSLCIMDSSILLNSDCYYIHENFKRNEET